MTPDKALELVQRYASLTRQLKQTTKGIGDSLSLCRGISGKRLDPSYYPELDNKNRELDLHLNRWYTPERGEYGSVSWDDVSAEEHGTECPHCYRAHLFIERRKEVRRELGQVKRVMSRSLS